MDNKAGPSSINKKHSINEEDIICKRKKLNDEELLMLLENNSSSDEFVPDSDSDESSLSFESEDNTNIPNVVTNTNQAVLSSDDKKWSNTGALKQLVFQKTEELLVPIPRNGTPIDFFQMIIDDDFLQTVVEQTNAYAVEVFLRPETSAKSRITTWKDVTVDELKIMLGLLFHTGTIHLSRLNDYWKTDPLFDIPVFKKYMSRNRFLLILECLHFTTPKTSPTDHLGKIESVVNFFNTKMNNIYYPGRELSLDEAMILWRGRLHFKQYIKNKHHKYGIKLYMLTEPNGPILKFRAYEGSTDVYSRTGHTEKIVLDLLEEKLGIGHVVYLHNFYNSVELATKLLQENTYCTGTLKVDRKNNPKEVMTANLKRGENKSMFCDGVHVGKWSGKHNVQYISTEYGNEMGAVRNRRGQKYEIPAAIISYNVFMYGVERHNQIMANYPCNHKTIRWYKKLFIHVLQMSLINAHFLYNKYSQFNPVCLYDFRLDVIRSLLSRRPIINLPRVSTPHTHVSHIISKIEKTVKETKGARESRRVSRKECKACRQKQIRKQTVYECKICPGQPGFCLQCFADYHKNI